MCVCVHSLSVLCHPWPRPSGASELIWHLGFSVAHRAYMDLTAGLRALSVCAGARVCVCVCVGVIQRDMERERSV